MKISSDKTGRSDYATVEECLADEAEFDRKEKELQIQKEAEAAERKVRADEVKEAYQAITDARNHFTDVYNKFVEDYGGFHVTCRSYVPTVPETSSLFEYANSIINMIDQMLK